MPGMPIRNLALPKEITAQCPFKGRTDNLIGEDYTQQCQ